MNGVIDIYARVSKLGDKDQTTTPSQVAVCRSILDERGYPRGETFTDDGKSAWNPKVYREGWHAVMDRLESGESAGVIVYDLERFARQLADGERLVTLAERGLTVLDSEGEYDLRKPGDKKNFRNAIVSAEYYSDLLRVKTRRGKLAKARLGQVDARRSFGFESDGVTVLDEEAAILRDWATRLLAGETQASIVAEANARGIPSVRGAKWGYTTFRQLMTRPRNIGLIVHNGEVIEGVRLPGEPILDRETHDRLVALYTARKPGRPPSGRYLLTGLADCVCGAPLGGRTVHGTSRKQYWCRTCMHTFVDARRLDLWAAEFTVHVLADPAHAEAVAEADAELKAERDKLEGELSGMQQTLREIGDRLGRGQITLDRHDAICGPLEARIAETAKALEALGTGPTPVPTGQRTIPPDDARYIGILDDWDSGTPESRRSMVVRALGGRRLTVGPGKDAKFDDSRVTVREH